MHRDQDHGWGSQLEVLIYVYWLAHGLSYRVVSSAFCVPKSTVRRVVHKVAQLIWLSLKVAIHLPGPDHLVEVGEGFGQLSGSPVLNCVVGAIDAIFVSNLPRITGLITYIIKGSFQLICRQYVIQMESF